MKSSLRLEYRSCINDQIGLNALKFVEIMWKKNKLVTIVVSCLFIFEARNFRVTACIASACVL